MGCQFLPDENLKKEVRQNKKKDWRLFYDWINLAPKIWYFVLFFFPVQLSGHRIKTVDKVAEEWHRKYDHLMLYSHTLVGKENEFYVTGINDFLCTSKMYCTLMQVPAELKNVKGKACLINLCYILNIFGNPISLHLLLVTKMLLGTKDICMYLSDWKLK